MKRVIDRQEQLDKKCELLIALGFTIHHNDSQVEYNNVMFDFSATVATEKDILYTAMKYMYLAGREKGVATMRNQMKALIFGEDE